MATGARAIARLAEAARLPQPVVLRTARALREADQILWPQAGRGGGRGAVHVEPQHLVSLSIGIAIAVASPVADVPKIVTGYRDMGWNTVPLFSPERTGHASSLLDNAGLFRPDITAGELLEDVLILLADQPDVAKTLRAVGWRIDLERDLQWPRISVNYIETDLPADAAYAIHKFILRPHDPPVGLSKKRDPAWNFLGPVAPGTEAMLHTVSLLTPWFEVLAELWNDTRRHHRKSISLPATASASAVPEHENAAALPGATASRLNQSSAERRRPGRQTSRKLQRSMAVIKEE
jgi:hypothetical protein